MPFTIVTPIIITPIIVQFTNRRVRNAVYAAHKMLSQKLPNVYVNEHFVKSHTMLLREARQLVKAKQLQGAWTSNGIVYIRLPGLPDSKPIRVDDMRDLPTG